MENQFEAILLSQLAKHYQTPRELKYANDPGFRLSPIEYEGYLKYVDGLLGKDKHFALYPLPSFNSSHIYHAFSAEIVSLVEDYVALVEEDTATNHSFLSDRNPFDFDRSRIYSEIEGSLNVESVPTTRRRVKDLLEKKEAPKSRNDIIISNMGDAIAFLAKKPVFNQENLFSLYTLLSRNCLEKDDMLRPGDFYRYDEVEVDGYLGCPPDRIEAHMNALFAYVNEQLVHPSGALSSFLLPHVCHYYLLLVHPYFDDNGRTARMVSFWINLLANNRIVPPLFSEAINQTKTAYYKAIRDARTAHNDMTYFLRYLLSTGITYYLCYKDLEIIHQAAKNKGCVLTETDVNYIKRIIVSYKGAFDYRDFLAHCNIEISKQGALKILNRFVDLGILKEAESKTKTKLFLLDKAMIKYSKVDR